jgi:hypothetical protein
MLSYLLREKRLNLYSSILMRHLIFLYSFNKEIIDDACMFLLQNPDLWHLTLGP